MALRTLWDSPLLAPLARAALRVGVEVELFGSVAGRALLFDAAKAPPRDLFELAEHVADIDLGHNGPPSVTPLLEEAIASEVPMAPWFRWSIVDREGLTQHDLLDRFNVHVPLRRMRLGTRPLADPETTEQLIARLLEGNVEIISTGSFADSPRAGFDTECSAVLLSIDASLDVLEAQLRAELPLRLIANRDRIRSIMRDGVGRLNSLPRAGREVAMRRLWYRLAGTGLRVSPSLFDEVVRYFGLEPLVAMLEQSGYPAAALGTAGKRPVVVSAYISEGVFRTPTVGGLNDGFGDWGGPFDELLSLASFDAADAPESEPIRLAAGNSVIAAIRRMPIHRGVSPSSGGWGPLAQDFIHIGLPVPDLARALRADRITAVVIGHGRGGTAVLPAFAQVSTALPIPYSRLDTPWWSPQRCTVRINLAGLVAEMIDVFLVQGDEE